METFLVSANPGPPEKMAVKMKIKIYQHKMTIMQFANLSYSASEHIPRSNCTNRFIRLITSIHGLTKTTTRKYHIAYNVLMKNNQCALFKQQKHTGWISKDSKYENCNNLVHSGKTGQ